MRRKLHEQLGPVTTTTEHVRARELEMMSRVLDQMPRALDLVHGDLLSGSERAREGPSRSKPTRKGIDTIYPT
jgi:hypothetical protein